MMDKVKIQNLPTIRRMPAYLHKLLKMKRDGQKHVSSTELAEYMHIGTLVVRKDIALTGISGLRRVGYEVDELITYIKDYLGWQKPFTGTLIGAGALGTALLGYADFDHYGFRITTVFDTDHEKIGHTVHGKNVLDFADFSEELRKELPDIAVICVPSRVAQAVTDLVVNAGIKYIWNFANVSLKVPEDVVVQREVIAGGLATLTFKRKAYEKNASLSVKNKKTRIKNKPNKTPF